MGLCNHKAIDVMEMSFGGPPIGPHECCGRSKFFAHGIPNYSKELFIVFKWVSKENLADSFASFLYDLNGDLSVYLTDNGYYYINFPELFDTLNKPEELRDLLAQWLESTKEIRNVR